MATQVGTHVPQVTGQNVTGMKTGLWNIRNDMTTLRLNIDHLLSSQDVNTKLSIFNDTVKLFSQFDVAEEVVLCSAIRNLGMNTFADTVKDQTILLEKVLYEMDQKWGTAIWDMNGFNDDVKRLKDVWTTHCNFLEGPDMLPRLETNLPVDHTESMNTWFDRIKTVAPTRPHPGGPHSTTGKLLTGPVLSFVDRFRDLSKQFSKTP